MRPAGPATHSIRASLLARLDPPANGSLKYVRFDGTTKAVPVHTFLRRPTDFPTRFATLQEAVGAAAREARVWEGKVTLAVVADADAFLVRPLQSQGGASVVIEGASLIELGFKEAFGTAQSPTLRALVGARAWMDLSSGQPDQPAQKL